MTSSMTQDHNLEKQVDKQLGCMAGFFQLFDRHHILTAKKFNTTKRLTSSSDSDNYSARGVSSNYSMSSGCGSEKWDTESPDVSKELMKPQTLKRPVAPPSPTAEIRPPTPPSWKFKEASRLSLDSRATYDAKGNIQMKEVRADRLILQSSSNDEDEEKRKSRSSTSVIARLMGLEPESELVKPPELRRCTSDSRFTRNLFHHQFIDGKDNIILIDESNSNAATGAGAALEPVKYDVGGESKRLNKGMMQPSESAWKTILHRKSFFETEEAFPEPLQKQSGSVYGEMEKRLKMKGIDEVTNDLDTLKRILEAWQLKGLLHSRNHEEGQHINFRNVVYDPSFQFEDSPILVPRHYPELPRYNRNGGGGGARRNLNIRGGNRQSVSPRRERNVRSPTRNEGNVSNVRGSNSIVKSKSLTIETRTVNGSTENRRGSSTMNLASPRGSPRKTGLNQSVANWSPRNGKKPTAEINKKEKSSTVVVPKDESSSVYESSLSTPSRNEVLDVMDSKGKNLLERCDKLLHSIAEMNATEQQSSPVSVLDSSFYESAASPSPIMMKRTIHLKENSDEVLEEDGASQLLLANQSELLFEDASVDCDLVYISEILRTCNYLPGHSDIALLEKQQCLNGKDTSNKVPRLRRQLIFDTINEILDRHRRLPPWIAYERPCLEKIWLEFQRIRGNDANRGNDLVETVCLVVKKDLAGDGWRECSVELSAVILDIERMIFRDLVTESIGDLAALAVQSSILMAPRRRLVF